MPRTSNFIKKLSSLSDFFESTLCQFNTEINLSNQNHVTSFFDCLITLSFKYKDLQLITLFKEIFIEKYKFKNSTLEETTIDLALTILSPQNADLIESMIKISLHKDLWKYKILEEFDCIISQSGCTRIKSATLFYLLIVFQSLGDSSLFNEALIIKAFKHALNSRNTVLTNMILKDIPITDPLKEQLLSISMGGTQSLYFHYLITHFNVTITKKILTMQQREWYEYKYVAILYEIQKEKYKDKFTPWDFLSIWLNYSPQFCRFKPTVIRTLMISLLPLHIVRHFTLISLVVLFSKSYPAVEYNSSWPNIHNLLCSDLCSPLSLTLNPEYKKYKTSRDYDYDELLNTLNHYFTRPDSIPDESIVTETYSKVKAILNRHKKAAINIQFFRSDYTDRWDYESNCYLNDIDDLIKQKQNKTLDTNLINPKDEIKKAFPHQEIY